MGVWEGRDDGDGPGAGFWGCHATHDLGWRGGASPRGVSATWLPPTGLCSLPIVL
jgi:hypothetical protein